MNWSILAEFFVPQRAASIWVQGFPCFGTPIQEKSGMP